MTSAQELELMKTMAQIRKELHELKNLINPLVPPKDEFLDTKGAIKLTGFSRCKIFNLMRDGAIPYTKKENRLRFSRNELIKWMQQTV